MYVYEPVAALQLPNIVPVAVGEKDAKSEGVRSKPPAGPPCVKRMRYLSASDTMNRTYSVKNGCSCSDAADGESDDLSACDAPGLYRERSVSLCFTRS